MILGGKDLHDGVCKKTRIYLAGLQGNQTDYQTLSVVPLISNVSMLARPDKLDIGRSARLSRMYR